MIWTIILLEGNDTLIFAAVVLFVLFLGYFGIRQMGIFSYPLVKRMEKDSPSDAEKITEPVPVMEVVTGKPTFEPAPAAVKYERSALQKENAEKIYRSLQQLMEIKKIFRKEELSLRQLADELKVHPNHLSQVINSYEGKSFYDYINKLRVEEFKKLVLNPGNSQFTLLSLAYDAGFNSKTSFNRNFKKITGQSPSAYLHDVNVKLVTE